MNIRKSILLSYMILVLIVIAYSSILLFFGAIQRRIDDDSTQLYQSREIWNDLLISMNELQINWSDGNTFIKFRETTDKLERSLNKMVVSKQFKIPFFGYNPGQRKIALYNTWSIAKESVFNIIRLVESQNFQRVISPIEKRPGLQRLNRLWMELFYQSDDEIKKDAYVIGQVIDSIEFFPIYSETLNHLFNIIIYETNLVTERIDNIRLIISIIFFLMFLFLYMIFALRFTGSISGPIIDLSLRLSSFMGRTLKIESYTHTNELHFLTTSVDNLIEHYTYLSKLAGQIAVGDLDSPLMDLPEQGVVGNALKDINGYLKELAETSQWIRDGNYGADVTVKSDKDILAINFNIMSKVILEKITTLSNMFEAVEESMLVVDYNGNFIEANNNLLQLFGMDTSLKDIESFGILHDFIKDTKIIENIFKGGIFDTVYTELINLKGKILPIKIIPKSMPIVRGQRNKIMLVITNESIRVRAEREREKLKVHAVEAELRALRAQINPHFLFNTLNAIAHLVESKSDRAVKMIEKLSELFRYSLASTRRRTVLISEEIEIIRQFLDIEKMRFGDNLTVEYHIDDNLTHNNIPPMLIQPVVENAVKYGSNENGKIDVTISIYREGQNLVVAISDKGSQVIDHQLLLDRQGTGIRNVNRRLKTLYNNQLQFVQNIPQGLKVLIQIPEDSANYDTYSYY
ncbi:MAG: histidine kinase [Spirochaetales bacterium]|nr:histidine kinase [Spirochaetales bacterium]